ncbi:MAG: hypothetical protein WKG07_21360 [Hymenobacter sp.]
MLLVRPVAAQVPELPDRPVAMRDSLRKLLQAAGPADTTRVNQLNALAFALRTNEAPKRGSWPCKPSAWRSTCTTSGACSTRTSASATTTGVAASMTRLSTTRRRR